MKRDVLKPLSFIMLAVPEILSVGIGVHPVPIHVKQIVRKNAGLIVMKTTFRHYPISINILME